MENENQAKQCDCTILPTPSDAQMQNDLGFMMEDVMVILGENTVW